MTRRRHRRRLSAYPSLFFLPFFHVRSHMFLRKRRLHVDMKLSRDGRARARTPQLGELSPPLRIPTLPTRGCYLATDFSPKKQMLASSNGQSSNYECYVSAGGAIGVSRGEGCYLGWEYTIQAHVTLVETYFPMQFIFVPDVKAVTNLEFF